jgi:hypothetical protein
VTGADRTADEGSPQEEAARRSALAHPYTAQEAQALLQPLQPHAHLHHERLQARYRRAPTYDPVVIRQYTQIAIADAHQ